MKQIVIGLGTGRCGTKSLAYLLNLQANAEVHHEKHDANIRWNRSEQEIDVFLNWCKSNTRQLVGDVSFYYLPYVNYIWHQIPTVKFVCLQRERKATVNSYMSWTNDKNHWINHDGTNWKLDEWDHCYPKYDLDDKFTAICRYYDEYYSVACKVQDENPNYFRIFPINMLNSISGQHNILDYIGISRRQRRIEVAVRLNYSALSWQNSRSFLRILGWLHKQKLL